MIILRQKNYIEKILKQYQLENAKPLQTLMEPGQILKRSIHPNTMTNPQPIGYMNMVRAL